MPLNKLENFIKNTEGRILYVNPSDLDATDSIENQGNSLTKPFKTVQRALLEAARFSYLRGSDNDIIEKTTILLYPGEHVIDNRPGFAIKDDSGTAKAVSPSGTETNAQTTLTLTTDSVFDLTQEDNILYKFNSIHGGVIVPRGTSIVGLDLRKTKLRPKYVPNPTDTNLSGTAIFRVTGTCYFWQFSIFDGDLSGTVYTDNSDFSSLNTATPSFSHHKLTVFEYADGINIPTGYSISDLSMYYSKLSNAYNTETGRNIDQKWPGEPLGFASKRPEYEIVGAFADDPVNISSIKSGDGFTPSSVITVTTSVDHKLTAGTPVKIKGISVEDYNVSTIVQSVTDSKTFTFLLPFVRNNLPASPSSSGSTVTIETDTVQGASPYIFNVSLRSVWGMNGMHADGSKATGFRSMVVAQFTAIGLQKDDRAFVKYNKSSRLYEGISVSKVTGSALASGSSSTNENTVYHLDSEAQYRIGWESSHIKGSNDSFMQIVSVFAIGFAYHFDGRTGADMSITNSNSNFGQISLNSSGFKKEAFAKDNKGYITSIITPKAITAKEEKIDWLTLDVGLTDSVGISSHLYLFGYNDRNIVPPFRSQGYRIGAKVGDELSFYAPNVGSGTTYSAPIYMVDNAISKTASTTATGTTSSVKEHSVTSVTSSILTIGSHQIRTGEKVLIISDNGDLPENLEGSDRIYFAIRHSNTQIKLASSISNAENGTAITIYYSGNDLKVLSRVSDKESGDVGSPIQFDAGIGNWYIKSSHNNDIYNALVSPDNDFGERTNSTFIKRVEDNRSLDEKLYKFRVVIPKELDNCKEPEEGFVLQESSTTFARSDDDFTASSITSADADFNRNPRFISKCTTGGSTVTVISEIPHDLNVGDEITVKNVTSTTNTAGTENKGYNGVFIVTGVTDELTFTYATKDVDGVTHNTGTFNNDTSSRTTLLPRFERSNWQSNFYIYRNDVIKPYEKDVSDGIYHLYVLNASNVIETEYGSSHYYSQKVDDLYPQLDRDNNNDNPESAVSYAKRFPVGDVNTNDLKKSLTRESADKLVNKLGIGLSISSVSKTSTTATLTFTENHNLNGITTFHSLTGGSGYTNGTYHNVKLFNNDETTWDGATATVTVSGNAVTSVDITAPGSAYTNNEDLKFDNTVIGSGSNAKITIKTANISRTQFSSAQITGIGTTSGGNFVITDIPGKNTVAVAITAGDPEIHAGQYFIHAGARVQVGTKETTSATGIVTFTTVHPHGFVVGNKMTVRKDSSNDYASMGDFIVTNVSGKKVTVNAGPDNTLPDAEYLLRSALSANDLISDKDAENLGSRGYSFYAGEDAKLKTAVTTGTSLEIGLFHSQESILTRFELGSYIQIDNEIMRVASSALTGSNNDTITVIRGVMGTAVENHDANSMIKKILLKPVEFRRPSYLRASGHTFEYLGYGPGNYSTALPQVQVRSLNEEEETLAQAQEKSCGIVVYTGMNNDGDFYIGNKKINSATGKEKTFDIPIPTITGEDPSTNQAVFDEVIVKKRIIVEGGNGNNILSQFDGPVTFNGELKMNEFVTIDNSLKTTGTVNINNETPSTGVDAGALTVDGGVGINENLYVGGDISGAKNINLTGAASSVTAIDYYGDGSKLTGITTSILYDSNDAVRVEANTSGAYVTGILTASTDVIAAGATIGNIRIGESENQNEITTTENDLVLKSATSRVKMENARVGVALTVVGLLAAKGGIEIQSGSSLKVADLTDGRVLLAGVSGLATDSANLTYGPTVDSGGLTIANTTQSSTTATGALVVTGGVGIGHKLYVGNVVKQSGGGESSNNSFSRPINCDLKVTASHFEADTAANTSTFAGKVSITKNTQASSATNAALVVTGGVGIGNKLYVTGDIVGSADLIAYNGSDRRWKDNITPIEDPLAKVMSISGNTFEWNESSDKEGLDTGVIAQEIESLGIPGIVTTRENGYKAVRYDRLIPLLIEAIKELNAKVDDLHK